MELKQRHIDIQNLKKYPEFYAFKLELEEFCDKMDSLQDMDLSKNQRVSISNEVFGRKWASEKVRDLLSTLGLVDKTHITRDMTFD